MISCYMCSRGSTGIAALASLGLAFAAWTPYASAGGVCQTGTPVNIDNGLQFVGDFLIVCEDGDWGVTMAFPFTIEADGTVDTARLTLFSNVPGLTGGGDVYVTGSIDDATGMSTCGLVPDITDIRATLCCGLVDVVAGVATDLVFPSVAVTAGETVWVLLVWRTQSAFSIGFDGGSADDSILGRMFLTDVGTGLPDDWVDIATSGSNFSADYAVELLSTGGVPGEFPCPPESCGDPKAGSCGEPNPTPGCDSFECCVLVCEADPICCILAWDQACANIAIDLCTPDLMSADGLWRAELDNFGQIVAFFPPDQPTTNNVFETLIFEANSQGDMLSRRMESNYTVVEGPTIALDGTSAFTRLEADDADLAIEIEILMLDGASGGALVKIRCENTGNAAVSCKLFYYCDYDISGSFANDEAVTIPDPANPIFAIEQIDDDPKAPKPLWFGGCPDYTGWELVTYPVLRTDLTTGIGELANADSTPEPGGPGDFDHTAALSGPTTELQPGEIVEFQAGLGGVDFDACGAPPDPCPADFDLSGDVGVKDLLFLLGAWGPCPPKGDCPADFDDSGDVGVKDLLFLLGAWGPC